jgi:hypothetical protein
MLPGIYTKRWHSIYSSALDSLFLSSLIRSALSWRSFLFILVYSLLFSVLSCTVILTRMVDLVSWSFYFTFQSQVRVKLEKDKKRGSDEIEQEAGVRLVVFYSDSV